MREETLSAINKLLLAEAQTTKREGLQEDDDPTAIMRALMLRYSTTYLCEDCYPLDGEVLTVVPLMPCQLCGGHQNVKAYARDPRK